MAPTSTFAKIWKLSTSWHALCCVFSYWLVVTCLASYPGFLVIAFAACGTLKVSRHCGWEVGWRGRGRNRPSNGGEPQNPRLTSVGHYCTTLAWGDFKSKAYVNSQISFHVWARRKIRESPRSASVGAERGRLSLLTTLSSLLKRDSRTENRPKPCAFSP